MLLFALIVSFISMSLALRWFDHRAILSDRVKLSIINKTGRISRYSSKSEFCPTQNCMGMLNRMSNSMIDDDGYRHLQKEFTALSRNRATISYKEFIGWTEIQALLADNTLNKNLLKDIWSTIVGSLKDEADYPAFFRLNAAIDELFELDAEEGDLGNNSSERANLEEVNEVASWERMDPWDPEISAETLFSEDFVQYLKEFFDKNSESTKKSKLTYNDWFLWQDVQRLLKEGNIDIICLKELWIEAVEYALKTKPQAVGQTVESLTRRLDQEPIDFDTFLRMNYRLEEVMEDIRLALEKLSDEDIDQYYRKEFSLLSNGKEIICYEQLIEWSVIQEMITNKELSLSQLQNIWTALPKQSRADKGVVINGAIVTEGINVEGFILLNNAIEDAISSFDLSLT